MKTIYRYQIPFLGQPIKAPIDPTEPIKEQILKVDIIRGEPSIWILCDTDFPEREINIRVYGTGFSMERVHTKENYLGSFIIGESEIYHCFLDEGD